MICSKESDKMPIRVLHVIGIMNRGGAETMIMNLYRSIDREKVQFDFVQNSNEPAAFDEEIQGLGGRIYHCPHYSGMNHFEYVRWWKQFFIEHKGEYSIVHGHLGSTAAIYLAIAKKAGIFTIAHSHSVYREKDLTLSSILYKLYSYPTRFIADYFFACSEGAAVSRYGRKVANNHNVCSVLHNAIDVDKYKYNDEVRQQFREKLGYDEKKFVIGHVGRFESVKNHEFLIDLFGELAKKKEDARLLLVGDGYLRENMQEKVNDLGLSSKVIFTGAREDVFNLIQAMDVFVFPSLYEGLPLALVEVQTSGLPCVTSTSISNEALIVNNIIKKVPLSSSHDRWIEAILQRENCKRTDYSTEIILAGYDVKDTARKLTEFYLNTVKCGG